MPVSAMPTVASVTTAAHASSSAAEQTVVDDGVGHRHGEPGGDDDPALGQRRLQAGRQLALGAAFDDGAVVGDPLGEQGDHVVGRRPVRDRRALRGRRTGQGGADLPEDLVAGAVTGSS